MHDASALISVVIPTFNRERHLSQCLESVCNQTYRQLEILVVDDGSTDGTRALVADWQARDPRVRYLFQKNAGVAAARNTALRAAQGTCIAFLDSDDAWLPWKLELQMHALQTVPEAGMVWTDMSAINEAGVLLHERYLRQMYKAYRTLSGPLFEQSVPFARPESAPAHAPDAVACGNIERPMFNGNLVHTSTVLIRRERLDQAGLFEEQMRRGGEDYAFHFRVCREGTVAFLDVPTTLYRVGSEDQITHRRNQVPFATAFLATLQAELARKDKPVPLSGRELRRILGHAHAWLGGELADAGELQPARPHLLQAIRYAPASRSAWKNLIRTFLPATTYQTLRRLKKRILHRDHLEQDRPGQGHRKQPWHSAPEIP